MRGISRRKVGGLLATAALAGTLAVGLTGSAGAEQARGGGGEQSAVIKAKLDGRDLFFDGPSVVERNAALKVVNKTDPREVGPHTFSLVRKSELPETRKEQRDCSRLEDVCKRIAKAHRFEPPFTINRPDVDRGLVGWDKRFGRRGDTWFTQSKGDSERRKVSAPIGRTLWYMCAIHPDMQGRIRVID